MAQSRCPSWISLGWTSCLFPDSFTHMHILAVAPSLVQTRPFPVSQGERLFVWWASNLAEMPSCCCCGHKPADRADPACGSLCLENAFRALPCLCISVVMEWISHLPHFSALLLHSGELGTLGRILFPSRPSFPQNHPLSPASASPDSSPGPSTSVPGCGGLFCTPVLLHQSMGSSEQGLNP